MPSSRVDRPTLGLNFFRCGKLKYKHDSIMAISIVEDPSAVAEISRGLTATGLPVCILPVMFSRFHNFGLLFDQFTP